MSENRHDASDEEEEEDFNPAQEVGSDNGDAEVNGHDKVERRQRGDDDEPAGDMDDEDDEAGGGNAAQDDEDEDEDEEDEDDEDAVTDRPRKRRRRDRMNQFIDVEAEVDEDEDEEEEEDEADKGFLNEEPEADNELPLGMDQDDRIHREIDRRRQQDMNADAEELAKNYVERYGKREKVRVQDTSVVPREFLQPGVDDPRIWGVKCKPGKEREVVYAILKRVESRANSRSPLKIFSVVERGGPTMGFVYVEARQQKDVMEAVDSITNCYPHSGFILLAIKEMPDILRVKPTEALKSGQYVRIKRAGLYQGDLAQVDDVTTNGLDVTVKIIPRLNYGVDDRTDRDGKRKRAPAIGAARPPPRAFSEIEAKKSGKATLENIPGIPRGYKYGNEEYIDGFLYKELKLQHLIVKDVHPTLEEVSRFSIGQKDGTENLDLSSIAASIKENTSGDNYQAGDVVEVYEGEQQGLWGKAVSVNINIVALVVSEGELKGQRIEVPAKSLQKRFQPGDHVKVIGNSRFAGEAGMVVGIKKDQVKFITDVGHQEITVFSKDLRVATDSGGSGSLGQYHLHDLVQLDGSTVGCITKIDRETMQVLDQFEGTRSVMPSQIANKIEKRRNAVATDRAGNEIRLEDTVKEVEGERRSGLILHIHRSFVFLMNREYMENSGIFVARATNVATIAAKGGRTTGQGGGPDLSRMNPALKAPGAGANGMMPPPRSFGGRDPVIGKNIVISKGPYKGLIGIVKDATDTHARVELHSKNKTLPIEKNSIRVKIKEGGNDSTVSYVEFASRGRGRGGPPGGGMGGGGGFGGSFGGRTPAAGGYGGSRTPMGASGGDGGRTPGWSSARTPAWAGNGGQTPAYGGGGRTPAWSRDAGNRTAYGGGGQTAYGGSGGQTSYGGGGGRTPAAGGWGTSYGGATAYGGSASYGGGTSYGGATYGDVSGGKTPAPGLDAPTPGAPTPGAPTPGAYGGYSDAPTPFAGGSKGQWGGDDEDDDGPRYAD